MNLHDIALIFPHGLPNTTLWDWLLILRLAYVATNHHSHSNILIPIELTIAFQTTLYHI